MQILRTAYRLEIHSVHMIQLSTVPVLGTACHVSNHRLLEDHIRGIFEASVRSLSRVTTLLYTMHYTIWIAIRVVYSLQYRCKNPLVVLHSKIMPMLQSSLFRRRKVFSRRRTN